jgi:hypothetical protein
MASPGYMVIAGQLIGTGAPLVCKTVGFTVKSLTLNAGGASANYTKNMADGSMYKRTTAGVGSLVTGGNGITPSPTHDGFTLGADADINAAGVVIDYVAVCE